MSDAAVYTGQAAVRAGVLVTGTEVLSGIISDRNGRGCRSSCASWGSTSA